MVRYRSRLIHDQDPLLGTACDTCERPLLLGQSVVFDEDDGSRGEHDYCLRRRQKLAQQVDA